MVYWFASWLTVGTARVSEDSSSEMDWQKSVAAIVSVGGVLIIGISIGVILFVRRRIPRKGKSRGRNLDKPLSIRINDVPERRKDGVILETEIKIKEEIGTGSFGRVKR